MEKINATQIFMTDKVIVRSGEDESFIGFQILPKDDTQGFFVKSSPFIKVAIKETDSEEKELLKGLLYSAAHLIYMHARLEAHREKLDTQM